MSLPVLTTLCPICYVSIPKYRCPRCSMRTCSLECSKAHKLRASCSGVRDPAKYLPLKNMKSSTIDMDFNFLQSVQKARDEAGRASKMEEKKSGKRKRRMADRKRALGRAIEAGVGVRVLPNGMDRMKNNLIDWDARYIFGGQVDIGRSLSCGRWSGWCVSQASQRVIWSTINWSTSTWSISMSFPKSLILVFLVELFSGMHFLNVMFLLIMNCISC
jgi:hypothetical protein